jgi:hypothetical protein
MIQATQSDTTSPSITLPDADVYHSHPKSHELVYRSMQQSHPRCNTGPPRLMQSEAPMYSCILYIHHSYRGCPS